MDFYTTLLNGSSAISNIAGLEVICRVTTLVLLLTAIALSIVYLLAWRQEDRQTCPCSEERFCERIKDTTRKEASETNS